MCDFSTVTQHTHTHTHHGGKKIAGQFLLPLDPTKKWQHFCFCQHQMGIHTEGFVHFKKADVFNFNSKSHVSHADMLSMFANSLDPSFSIVISLKE